MAKKLKLPSLQVPCSMCQQNLKQTEKAAMIVCLHNEIVAIMPFDAGKPSGIWQVFTPATPADVVKILKQKGESK